MKLLKTNNWIAILIIVMMYSCENNSIQINSYKNQLINKLISETQIESKTTSTTLDSYKLKDKIIYMPNALVEIDWLKEFNDSLNKIILELDTMSFNKINTIKNLMISHYSTYSKGSKNWSIDTTFYALTNCNPADTMLISKILHQFELLNKKSNIDLEKAIILQLNQNIFDNWKDRFDFIIFRCFGPIPESILQYNSKVFQQNEVAYIYPNLFATSYEKPVYLLKENSTEFIMKNGKKKEFTNPISLKASATKGVHTVNGVIMITQKGELVPKPFEFRYIVEEQL